jgi:sugar phosphate isomerase/epimerase
MRLGYNTNGLCHHDLVQAIELLAQIGYGSVAITVDHGALNPFHDGWSRQVDEVRRVLQRYDLGCVVETGARFLLDPLTKHEPTLVTADAEGRRRRIDFLKHCVQVARQLGSDCVSCWSGVLRDGAGIETGFGRLEHALRPVLEAAARHEVVIAFEPEPGMLIDSMQQYARLIERIDDPRLALTMDIGHLHSQRETPIADQIRRWAPRLANVHIEDMRAGVHEHLMFGEGEVDFPPVIAALYEVGYAGGVHVELSRHSHEGPSAAQRAYQFLRPLIDRVVERPVL